MTLAFSSKGPLEVISLSLSLFLLAQKYVAHTTQFELPPLTTTTTILNLQFWIEFELIAKAAKNFDSGNKLSPNGLAQGVSWSLLEGALNRRWQVDFIKRHIHALSTLLI